MKKSEREKYERILRSPDSSKSEVFEANHELFKDGIGKVKSRKPFHCEIKDVNYVLIKYKRDDLIDDEVECKFKDECGTCPHEKNQL